MPQPHDRHRLSWRKRILHAGNAVRHIILQAVILSGMNPNHKRWISGRNLHEFPEHRLELNDVIDFFSDNVAPCYIRII